MRLEVYAPAHGMRKASVRLKQISPTRATASLSDWRKALSKVCPLWGCGCILEFRIRGRKVSPIANPYKGLVEVPLPQA